YSLGHHRHPLRACADTFQGPLSKAQTTGINGTWLTFSRLTHDSCLGAENSISIPGMDRDELHAHFVLRAQGILAAFISGWYHNRPDNTLVTWIKTHVFIDVELEEPRDSFVCDFR
ncbi:hypothetical protein POUND7_001769, partial [Theobroma cacao]